MVSAAVDPDHVEVTLEAGESTTINKHVTIPEDTTPDKVDVALLVDLSGSYSNDLPNIKSQIPEVFQDLVDAGIDTRFGLSSFIDFPLSPWGGSSDYAYQRDLDLTSDQGAFSTALNALTTGSGFDGPESQYEGVFQTATGAGNDIPGTIGDVPAGMGMSFRTDALKVIIITTDAPFHTPGDSNCSGGDACPFGYPGTSRDDTVAALNANGIAVIALKAPGSGSEMDDLADSTGGSVQTTDGSSSDIGNAIVAGLSEVSTTIMPFAVEPCAVDVSFAPESITFPAEGGEGDFTETVTVPEDTEPGTYTCQVSFGVAGTQTLVVTVPDDEIETQLDAQAYVSSNTSARLLRFLRTRLNIGFDATLTAEGAPLAGEEVVFSAGSYSCSGVTNANGMASCSLSLRGLLSTVLNFGYTAEFAGNPPYLPSSDSGALLFVNANVN